MRGDDRMRGDDCMRGDERMCGGELFAWIRLGIARGHNLYDEAKADLYA